MNVELAAVWSQDRWLGHAEVAKYVRGDVVGHLHGAALIRNQIIEEHGRVDGARLLAECE